MANVIVPNKPSKDIIVIDGRCYELIGSTASPPTHAQTDITAEFDDCETCLGEELSSQSSSSTSKSSSSSSQSSSSSSSGGGGATKEVFGLTWTNGETKLIDGTFNNSGNYENWIDPWTGAGDVLFMTFGGSGSELLNNFVIQSAGGDAPHRLDLLSYGVTFSPLQYTNYSTNIATKWKNASQMGGQQTTIPTDFWGVSSANAGQITVTATPDNVVIKWWRSGNDTNIKITW